MTARATIALACLLAAPALAPPLARAQDTPPPDPRIAALETTVKALQDKVATIEQRLDTAARLQAAALALDAGRKLGPIPGAPPALARYADTSAPTEPALRLAFPAAAHAAEAASPPKHSDALIDQAWQQFQRLVTIRQNGKIVAGTPTAATIATAQARLDAGDLAGALAALQPLDPPARAAMAPWLADAENLLAARRALEAMMAPG